VNEDVQPDPAGVGEARVFELKDEGIALEKIFEHSDCKTSPG
jgi:hypothetical protein